MKFLVLDEDGDGEGFRGNRQGWELREMVSIDAYLKNVISYCVFSFFTR